MTLLRRLCICLLALALLPGATLQARILATPIAPAGPAQPQHDEAAADCHAALPVQEADSGNADPRQGAGPADDCCGDGASSAGCSQHCACPATTPALLPTTSAVPFAMRPPHGAASAARGAGRRVDGPPKRPPIS